MYSLKFCIIQIYRPHPKTCTRGGRGKNCINRLDRIWKTWTRNKKIGIAGYPENPSCLFVPSAALSSILFYNDWEPHNFLTFVTTIPETCFHGSIVKIIVPFKLEQYVTNFKIGYLILLNGDRLEYPSNCFISVFHRSMLCFVILLQLMNDLLNAHWLVKNSLDFLK